jgi:UDP-sugar transporter A1/2/3
MYSAASAVLLNECLKGTISLSIAFYNALHAQPPAGYAPLSPDEKTDEHKQAAGRKPWEEVWTAPRIKRAAGRMRKEIFRCVV